MLNKLHCMEKNYQELAASLSDPAVIADNQCVCRKNAGIQTYDTDYRDLSCVLARNAGT